MSDDQKPGRAAEHEEPKDEVEVEAHRKGSKLAANEEPDDEVEAHRHGVRNAEPDNRFS
jgi:hypothetical protein